MLSQRDNGLGHWERTPSAGQGERPQKDPALGQPDIGFLACSFSKTYISVAEASSLWNVVMVTSEN
jgi:hypothetical protein